MAKRMERVEEMREKLLEEIKEKERESDKILEELISKKKMKFCSRCGKVVNYESEWGGKCAQEGCENLICKECWRNEEFHLCNTHSKIYVNEVKKEVKEDEIKTLTLNYIDILKERLKRQTLDWSPRGFIRNKKVKIFSEVYNDFEAIIYEKGFIKKRPKIKIFVRQVTKEIEKETNSILEKLDKNVYNIIVFVGNSNIIDKNMVDFSQKFSSANSSLFLIDMENKKIYYNQKEKISEKYADWFDPSKTPKNFLEILESISEIVAGKRVIDAKKFAEEMGLKEEESIEMLKKSKLVEEVKGTKSFIIKL
ncbi:MAG: hypothetical protein QW051_01085 [Candidatus Aenigmatarchaeota archaeon]